VWDSKGWCGIHRGDESGSYPRHLLLPLKSSGKPQVRDHWPIITIPEGELLHQHVLHTTHSQELAPRTRPKTNAFKRVSSSHRAQAHAHGPKQRRPPPNLQKRHASAVSSLLFSQTVPSCDWFPLRVYALFPPVIGSHSRYIISSLLQMVAPTPQASGRGARRCWSACAPSPRAACGRLS